jgi:hypothetical protein
MLLPNAATVLALPSGGAAAGAENATWIDEGSNG